MKPPRPSPAPHHELLLAALLALGAAPAARATPELEAGHRFFREKIEPVLRAECYECHAASAKKLRGGLRLDLKAGVLAGGNTGPALVPGDGRSLILAAAMISILINPAAFAAAERIRARLDKARPAADVSAAPPEPAPLPRTALTGHAILVGFGRVGMTIAEALREQARPLVVIEDSKAASDAARARGLEVVEASGVDRDVLAAANVGGARTLHVAVPDGFEAGTIVERAKALNPAVVVIARGHSDEERAHLEQLGADHVVMGEREIGLAMVALEPSFVRPVPASEKC